MQHAMGGKGTSYSTEQIQKEARRLLWDHFGLIVNPGDPTATNIWWAMAKDQVHLDAQTHRWIGPTVSASGNAKSESADRYNG